MTALTEARAHAQAEFPNEACGVFVAAGKSGRARKFIPQPNKSETPTTFFEMDYNDDAGKVVALMHSHTIAGTESPSESDMRQQIASDVPWCIIPVSTSGAGEPFWVDAHLNEKIRPWLKQGVPDTRIGGDYERALIRHMAEALTGLPWRSGVTDCYSIVRDFYFLTRRVQIDEIPRGFVDGKSGMAEGKQVEPDWEAMGFEKIAPTAAKEGDLLTMRIRSKLPNHCALLVAPGLILHHPGGRKSYDPTNHSRRDPLNQWQRFIVGVYRFRPR